MRKKMTAGLTPNGQKYTPVQIEGYGGNAQKKLLESA